MQIIFFFFFLHILKKSGYKYYILKCVCVCIHKILFIINVAHKITVRIVYRTVFPFLLFFLFTFHLFYIYKVKFWFSHDCKELFKTKTLLSKMWLIFCFAEVPEWTRPAQCTVKETPGCSCSFQAEGRLQQGIRS